MRWNVWIQNSHENSVGEEGLGPKILVGTFDTPAEAKSECDWRRSGPYRTERGGSYETHSWIEQEEPKMRMFPILNPIPGCVSEIPWDLIGQHEGQAGLNHAQSLQTLAERGGLAYAEALAVLEDRPFRDVESSLAEAEIGRRIAARDFPGGA